MVFTHYTECDKIVRRCCLAFQLHKACTAWGASRSELLRTWARHVETYSDAPTITLTSQWIQGLAWVSLAWLVPAWASGHPTGNVTGMCWRAHLWSCFEDNCSRSHVANWTTTRDGFCLMCWHDLRDTDGPSGPSPLAPGTVSTSLSDTTAMDQSLL